MRIIDIIMHILLMGTILGSIYIILEFMLPDMRKEYIIAFNKNDKLKNTHDKYKAAKGITQGIWFN